MSTSEGFYMSAAYNGRSWLIVQVQGDEVLHAIKVRQQRVKAEKLAKLIARKLRIPFRPWSENKHLAWNDRESLPQPDHFWVNPDELAEQEMEYEFVWVSDGDEYDEYDEPYGYSDTPEWLSRIKHIAEPPTTPKPKESDIPSCVPGSIRSAGSGRWLADIKQGEKIKTIYVE